MTAALAAVGFEVGSLSVALDSLALARADAVNAEQEGKQATSEREAAFLALKAWQQPFHRAVRLALKNRPDLLTPLGL